MIAPMWLTTVTTSLRGRRAQFVPLIECVFCDQEHAADYECLAMKQVLRRELHAVADTILPEIETAPELPRAANDAEMKGPRHE